MDARPIDSSDPRGAPLPQILFGYHPVQMPAIARDIDHHRFTPSFAPIDAVDARRFDLVVPLTIDQIAPARATGRAVVPDAATVALCDDKLAFNRWLIDAGFGNAVPALLGDAPTRYPSVRKGRHGDYGAGVRIVRGPGGDVAPPADSFAQAAVEGRYEYVLHMLRIGGRLRFHDAYRYDMSQPLAIRGAEARPASIVPADPDAALELCGRILDALDYQGTCCFNYKFEDEAVWLLELNPRFGGSLVGEVTAYLAAHLAARP